MSSPISSNAVHSNLTMEDYLKYSTEIKSFYQKKKYYNHPEMPIYNNVHNVRKLVHSLFGSEEEIQINPAFVCRYPDDLRMIDTVQTTYYYLEKKIFENFKSLPPIIKGNDEMGHPFFVLNNGSKFMILKEEEKCIGYSMQWNIKPLNYLYKSNKDALIFDPERELYFYDHDFPPIIENGIIHKPQIIEEISKAINEIKQQQFQVVLNCMYGGTSQIEKIRITNNFIPLDLVKIIIDYGIF